MIASMLMALQASAGGAATHDAIDFDLRSLPKQSSCQGGGASDIVVCARAGQGDRLRPVEDSRFAQCPLRAELDIGPARGSLYVEQKDLPGASSQRVMAKVKIPF